MSAEASFPVVPKWILMNFPWETQTDTQTEHHIPDLSHLSAASLPNYLWDTTTIRAHVCCHFRQLTKRDELSLRMVLALPNASIAGLASMIWSSKDPCRHNRHNIIKDGGTGWWTVKTGEKTHAFLYGFPQSCDNGKVLDDPLGVYRLPCTRLSTNEKTHTKKSFGLNDYKFGN